jgi:hypothetical protein
LQAEFRVSQISAGVLRAEIWPQNGGGGGEFSNKKNIKGETPSKGKDFQRRKPQELLWLTAWATRAAWAAKSLKNRIWLAQVFFFAQENH